MRCAAEFYRHLGVDVPEGAESEEHVEIAMGDLTFFLSTTQATGAPVHPSSDGRDGPSDESTSKQRPWHSPSEAGDLSGDV